MRVVESSSSAVNALICANASVSVVTEARSTARSFDSTSLPVRSIVLLAASAIPAALSHCSVSVLFSSVNLAMILTSPSFMDRIARTRSFACQTSFRSLTHSFSYESRSAVSSRMRFSAASASFRSDEDEAEAAGAGAAYAAAAATPFFFGASRAGFASLKSSSSLPSSTSTSAADSPACSSSSSLSSSSSSLSDDSCLTFLASALLPLRADSLLD
mmetsp:Transcript_6142/g.17999  ORF Transcript_6142/g.17999 Transcript_6142/m.17999 type:complete len:216 (+) Transcript_6142:2069-2716(+)